MPGLSSRGRPGEEVLRQYVGEVKLANGGSMHLRCMDRFSMALWDEVMAPFEPLSAHDILLLNFGGTGLPYTYGAGEHPWEGWKQASSPVPCVGYLQGGNRRPL